MTTLVVMGKEDFEMVEAGALSVEAVRRKSDVVEINQPERVVMNSVGTWSYYRVGRTALGVVIVAGLGPSSHYSEEAERLKSKLNHPTASKSSSQAGLSSFCFAQAGVPTVENR